MTILIIDDSIPKCRIIEEVLKDLGESFISVYAINTAKKILLNEIKVDGIVLDMQLPIYPGNKSSIKDNGGQIFLKWLEHHNYKIPVLGNSIQEFNTDYQYFQGQMIGVYDSKIFKEFLSSIKDHS